ncbi:MAG: hypothetical protein J6K26_09595 [Lachnospiraceae bacterium]|nr:hypothetical protein [Lachnospiraceae bacterium]
MIAEKGNKVYKINESMKSRYEADGFDIKDDSGKLISAGKRKTVPYEEYQKVVAELEALRATISGSADEFSKMTVEELKAYAEEHGIDIGNASSQSGISKKIREALKENQ